MVVFLNTLDILKTGEANNLISLCQWMAGQVNIAHAYLNKIYILYIIYI